jgi:hypothetical protein
VETLRKDRIDKRDTKESLKMIYTLKNKTKGKSKESKVGNLGDQNNLR